VECYQRFYLPSLDKQVIPPLVDTVSDSLVFDIKVKSNLLKKNFCSQSTLINSDKDSPIINFDEPQNKLEIIKITLQDVEDALKSLKINEATGPDEISKRILRETTSELKTPLSSLFNFSLQCSTVPLSWKEAHVCAVFKKGDPSMPNNFRPIYLLCCPEKVNERVVFKHLYIFFRDNTFLSTLQSGFTPGD
jgi:hypothetical protein